MSLSIIIPTNKLDHTLACCLRSIEKAFLLEDEQLILVLDGVQKDNDFFNKFTLPQLVIVQLNQNYGPELAVA